MEVPFAVILNARGAVVSARALRRVSTAVERAAGQGLGLWRFRPSSLKGRPVADWIVVTVRVEAGS
jgi:hypothetical protein